MAHKNVAAIQQCCHLVSIYNNNGGNSEEMVRVRQKSESDNWAVILSGLIGKVITSHAEDCRVDSRLKLLQFILCTRCSGSTAHEGGGCVQTIGSTVFRYTEWNCMHAL